MRMLGSLRARGFVRQTANGTFELGVRTLDLANRYSRGDVRQDLPLCPGDIIRFLPSDQRQRRGSFWNQILKTLITEPAPRKRGRFR